MKTKAKANAKKHNKKAKQKGRVQEPVAMAA
jgi:hypothetical protein